MQPPANGSILWQFCEGKFSRCGGGNGNWWSPTFAMTRNGTLVVAALGKAQTNPKGQRSSPTFVDLRRSSDRGVSFGPSMPLLDGASCTPAVGCGSNVDSTVFNGGTLAHCTATDTLHLVFAVGSPSGNLSIISSTDAGGSWSAARAVTNSQGERWVTSGQVNRGLELQHGPHAGRLVFPREQFLGAAGSKVGVVFSDTHGETFEAGGDMLPPFRQGESAVAEVRVAAQLRPSPCHDHRCCRQLGNGSLIITARNAASKSKPSGDCVGDDICRVFARSDNAGRSWGAQWHVPLSELPSHRCEAAMVSVQLPGHPIGALLFGAPMNATTRADYTIYYSLDGGRAWARGAAVYGGQAGYSSLVVLGGASQASASGSWSVEVGVAFQLGHGIHGVEGGGYDMAFARRTVHIHPSSK